MSAASPEPSMSEESARSVTRSATLRLMFDCISGVTTPEGRWVASTRFTPSERPTRAMRTSPSMNSGSSVLQLGELVDDDHQAREPAPGGGLGVLRPGAVDVLRVHVAQHPLASLQLGVERGERALGLARVEVRHHADRVRQPLAVGERRPALVVDEHEVQRVGAVRHREAHDERLQELGLARAGRARDERVGAVARDVEGELAVGVRADHDEGVARLGLPPLHEMRRVVEVDLQQVDHAHARGQHRVVADAADVADRAEAAGDLLGRARARRRRAAPSGSTPSRSRSGRARHRRRR